MCQWCVEDPKCSCQVECEVELSTSNTSGIIITKCPRCRHIIQRIP